MSEKKSYKVDIAPYEVWNLGINTQNHLPICFSSRQISPRDRAREGATATRVFLTF